MQILASIKLIAGILLLSAVTGIGVYVSNLKSDLDIAVADNKTLISAHEKQNKLIDSIKLNLKAVQTYNRELDRIKHLQQTRIKKLNERFTIKANGLSRNFASIARAKPKIVNKLVNKATENVNRCLELSTGAELLKNETNKECPELIELIEMLSSES